MILSKTLSIVPIPFKFEQSTACKKILSFFFVPNFSLRECIVYLLGFQSTFSIIKYIYLVFDVQYIVHHHSHLCVGKENLFYHHKINTDGKMDSIGKERERSKRTRIPREMNI